MDGIIEVLSDSDIGDDEFPGLVLGGRSASLASGVTLKVGIVKLPFIIDGGKWLLDWCRDPSVSLPQCAAEPFVTKEGRESEGPIGP